jgi:hypothetical protein
MTARPSITRTLRGRATASLRRILPSASRYELEQVTTLYSSQVDVLRAEMESSATRHGVDIGPLASDLTEMIGLRLAENAETHDLLANLIEEVRAEATMAVRAMSPQ